MSCISDFIVVCHFTFESSHSDLMSYQKKNKKLRLKCAAQMRKEDNGWKTKVKS